MQNHKHSIIPSGYYGNSSNNIVVIKNFINLEDLKKIQNFCINLNEFEPSPGDDWHNRVCNNSIITKLDIEISKLLYTYQLKHKKIIEDFFDVDLSDNIPNIVIWRTGDSQLPHADKENLDGSENPYPENDIASLLYLNEEYSGGEIYFPIQGVELKMNAGDAVFFPGDRHYQHGVKEITKGKRFTCPAFWNVLVNHKESNNKNTIKGRHKNEH
jgi:hypothetical protein